MGLVHDHTRREPESSVLYRVLAEHLEGFLIRVDADPGRAGLPRFVVRELRAYLQCGQLSRGFCRVRCTACGKEILVAFSCKRRGFCPSCCGRRMSDLAAHLVDRVLPEVPIRQWVLSVPFALRYPLAYDAALCHAVKGVIIRAVMGWTKRRAASDGAVGDLSTGAVVATQRFDSALRLGPHWHALVLDGAFTGFGPGRVPRFVEAAVPSPEDITRLVRTIYHRLRALLTRRGVLSDDGQLSLPLFDEPSALDQCPAAAVQGRSALGPHPGAHAARTRKCPDGSPRAPSALSARCEGFSLEAGVSLEASDRVGLERLCRYLTRPPLATERLSLQEDDRVRYRFRRPWRDGTTGIVLHPHELIERLAALVPRPRTHLLTYHGVLAPAAGWRSAVVPACEQDGEGEESAARCVSRAAARASGVKRARRPRTLWAELLLRVYGHDVLQCPCGGRRSVLTFLSDPAVIVKILAHLGLDQPGGHARARPPPELEVGAEEEFWGV